VGPGLASREWQPFQAKLPVEPMPAADRTGLKTRPHQEKRQEKRQAKHQEKIVLLRFACGYRLGADSRAGTPS
jgi:hypothetical protein